MIRLAMLARDEAARLPAVAENLGAIVGAVTILLDDRTSDDTAEVAEQLWADAPGGGEVIPFTFTDFGQARNELLAAARESAEPGDYLLLLDPDSPLYGELPSSDELTEAAYECDWTLHGSHWSRVVLLRADVEARYEGAVHEVLWVGAPTAALEGCYVEAHVTAGRERLEWIEGVLRRDAATSPRSAFYLAQTLRDLHRPEEAFGWYMRRAAMGGGWVEETFCAVYEAARLVERFDYELARVLWKRGLTLRQRAEPCYELARQANRLGDHSEALSWATLGLRLGASTDQLFVNRWVEQEGLAEEFTKAAEAMLPGGKLVIELPTAPLS